MKHSYKVVPVTEAELRKMFSDGQYWIKVKAGDLRQRLVRVRHPCPPRAQEPVCIASKIISYHDTDGKKVAIVHQYVRPDGTLGASGMPDPKTLLIGDTLYTVQEPKNPAPGY